MDEDSAVDFFNDIQVHDYLNYVERTIAIFDRKTKTLRNNVADLVKV